MRFSPKMINRTATSESAALLTSGLPALGSRYSGSSDGPTTSSRIMTGTLIRNTAPHQKYCRIRPPSSGPIAPPSEKAMIQTLIAVVRSRGSWNMLRINDSVDGASVAPAIPSSARDTISIVAVRENAASTDATAKNTAPSSSNRRRPMRSPSVPMVMSEPASRKP